MWKMIQQLSETGVTIFLTTQYLDEAEALADRIAILDQGIIIAEGTNEELKDIISSNIIKLSFRTVEDTYKAQLLLNEYNTVIDEKCNELKIETHDSTDEVIRIFTRLKTGNLEIEDFEKKKASLEDVFLEVISGGQERGMRDAVSG